MEVFTGGLGFWNVVALGMLALVISCFFESRDPLRFYAKYVGFGVYCTVIAVTIVPYLLLSPKNCENSRVGACLMRYYTKLLGIEWESRGNEELRIERGCVVVANHQSILDVLGMFNVWHVMGRVAAIARNEVFYVLPFGPIAWLAGVVFINRNNGRKSMETLKETSELAKNQATKLFIFPEGTRNKNILGNGLQPFKKGAFIIAIENQVPVLPMVISPYYFIEEKIRFFGHGKMIIKTLDAIPTKGLGMDDVNNLIERTSKIMEKEFNALAIEVLAALPKDYPANRAQREQFANATRIITSHKRSESSTAQNL